MVRGCAQELTHLSNDSRFELPALIGVELLWWRETEEKLIGKLVGHCGGLLVWYWVCLYPPCKVICCNYNVRVPYLRFQEWAKDVYSYKLHGVSHFDARQWGPCCVGGVLSAGTNRTLATSNLHILVVASRISPSVGQVSSLDLLSHYLITFSTVERTNNSCYIRAEKGRFVVQDVIVTVQQKPEMLDVFCKLLQDWQVAKNWPSQSKV